MTTPTPPSGTTAPRPAGPRGLFRSRDPLRRYREIHGRRARIRWWHRLRAIVVLAALVALLGVLLAGLVGVLFFVMTFILEAVS